MNIYILQRKYEEAASDDHLFKAFSLLLLLVLNSIAWDGVKFLFKSKEVEWDRAANHALGALLSILLAFLSFIGVFLLVDEMYRLGCFIAFWVFDFYFAINGVRFLKAVSVRISSNNLEQGCS